MPLVGNPHEPDDHDPDGIVDPTIIAERRARRAELNEGRLRERAVIAETQLEVAQRQLDGAYEQRKDLAAALKRAERDLRAARQGEHAEAHRREEIEEEAAVARRDAEQRIASIQAALTAGEQRVAELEDELARVRREAALTHGASVEADALLAAGLEAVVQVEERLQAQLVFERAARMRAARALESERERATAEVTLLQHELDRRAQVHQDVARQLVELRVELQATQAQVIAASGRKTIAESVLSDLGNTALLLRDELRGVEGQREDIDRQLREQRGETGDHADVTRLRSELEQHAAATARAEGRIVELEDELEEMRVALRPPAPLPPPDHPALKAVTPAGPADPAEPDSVIIDLARAAARLRIRKDEAADAEVTDLRASSAEVEIGRRMPAIGRHAPKAWLTPAIMSLARRDGHAAALVIQALVPVQAARLRQDLVYDLVVAGQPELRVQLSQDGTATVAPRTGEDAPATFRIAGAPVALAPLAGGAVRRRVPAGMLVSGSRRKARRLRKALRDPVGLAEIADAGVPLAPHHLLSLLAGAVDPRLTVGERFTIAFAADEGPVHTHLTVSDSAPIVVRAGEPAQAAATVRTAPGALAGFLAGAEPGRVRGDADAVGKLLGWADVAQGLDR